MKRSGLNCLVCIIAILLIRVSAVNAAERAQVQAVRLAEQGDATRIELRLSRSADFKMFTLTRPDRVVLDISAAALGRSALPLPGATGSVRNVRAAHRDGDLRIVFDLTGAMRPTSTTASEGSIARLTIELQAPASSQSAASPESSPSPVTVSAPEPEPGLRPQPEVAAKAAPVAEKPIRPARDIVVVVDAGHGGHDPGAHGARGLREKDVTLAISKRLVRLINNEPNMRAVLTRDDDRFLGLRERMERARSASADLFISIHADAAMNRSARGSTVYVLSEKAASDEASRRLAARENAALIGGVELALICLGGIVLTTGQERETECREDDEETS